jgi:hypothetical protein
VIDHLIHYYTEIRMFTPEIRSDPPLEGLQYCLFLIYFNTRIRYKIVSSRFTREQIHHWSMYFFIFFYLRIC